MATGPIKAYSPILTTRRHTSSTLSIASGESGSTNITIGLSGYTPIGIVAIDGTSTTGISYSDWYLADASTVKIYWRNNGGAKANTVFGVKILYQKAN